MNQTKQMREVVHHSMMEAAKAVGAQIVQMVIDGKGTLGEQVIIFSVDQLNDLAEAITQVIAQALAAEPAPLVRLTIEEIEKLQHGDITCWNWDDTIIFARAIQNAMDKKNGGQV